MLKSKIFLPLVLIAAGLAAVAYAATPPQPAPPQIVLPRWVSLSTDSRDTVREIIRSEVDNREGFSTTQEEKANLKAFYDDKFGTWTRSRIYDESNKYHETTMAYVLQGSQKITMYDIDRHGRGIEIQPQTSVTMGLIFKNVPANIKAIKVNLHPFIYYGGGFTQRWQEFDLPMPNMRMSGTSPTRTKIIKEKYCFKKTFYRRQS